MKGLSMTFYSMVLRDIPEEVFHGYKLKNAQIIEASNILKYVEESPDREWVDEEFYLIPQFMNLFIEMRSESKTGGLVGFKAGFWITAFEKESKPFEDALNILKPQISDRSDIKWVYYVKQYAKYPDNCFDFDFTAELAFPVPREKANMLLLYGDDWEKSSVQNAMNDPRIGFFKQSGIIHPMMHAIIAVDQYGRILNNIADRILMIMSHPMYTANIFFDQQEVYAMGLSSMIPTPLYALSLMACKNTGTYTVPLTKRQKRENKKPNKKVKNFPYRIIYLKDSITEKDSDAQKRVASDLTGYSVNIRRGHFREYQKDKPLFGRKNDDRFYGRFWISPKESGQKTHILKK